MARLRPVRGHVSRSGRSRVCAPTPSARAAARSVGSSTSRRSGRRRATSDLAGPAVVVGQARAGSEVRVERRRTARCRASCRCPSRSATNAGRRHRRARAVVEVLGRQRRQVGADGDRYAVRPAARGLGGGLAQRAVEVAATPSGMVAAAEPAQLDGERRVVGHDQHLCDRRRREAGARGVEREGGRERATARGVDRAATCRARAASPAPGRRTRTCIGAILSGAVHAARPSSLTRTPVRCRATDVEDAGDRDPATLQQKRGWAFGLAVPDREADPAGDHQAHLDRRREDPGRRAAASWSSTTSPRSTR